MKYRDWNEMDDFSKKYIDEAVQAGEMKYKQGLKIIAHHDPFRKFKETDELSKNSMILKTIAYHDTEVFAPNPNVPDYTIGNYGTVINNFSTIKMHHIRTKNKYHLVKVMSTKDKNKFPRVDTLVMGAFCPQENNKLIIDHSDGTLHKNFYHPDYGVLSWTDPKEKMEESLIKHEKIIKKQGRFSGQNAYNSIYSNAEIATICEALIAGLSREDAVLSAGLQWNEYTQALVSKMINKEKWRVITSRFPEIYRLANHRSHYDTHQEREIRIICDLLTKGLNDDEVSKLLTFYGYKTSPSYIRHIRFNDISCWKELVSLYTFPKRNGDRVELTDMEVHDLCKRLIAGGKSRYDVAMSSGKFDDRTRQMVEEFMRKLLLNYHKTYSNITSFYFPIDPMQINIIYNRIRCTDQDDERIADELTSRGYKTSPLLVEAIREVGSSPEETIKSCTIVTAGPRKKKNFTDPEIEQICRIIVETPPGYKIKKLRETGLFNDFSNEYLKLFMKNLRRNKIARYASISNKFFKSEE